jgi:hypothetical protein
MPVGQQVGRVANGLADWPLTSLLDEDRLTGFCGQRAEKSPVSLQFEPSLLRESDRSTFCWRHFI